MKSQILGMGLCNIVYEVIVLDQNWDVYSFEHKLLDL